MWQKETNWKSYSINTVSSLTEFLNCEAPEFSWNYWNTNDTVDSRLYVYAPRFIVSVAVYPWQFLQKRKKKIHMWVIVLLQFACVLLTKKSFIYILNLHPLIF